MKKNDEHQDIDDNTNGDKVAQCTAPLPMADPIAHDISPENIPAATQEFTDILGPKNIISDNPTLCSHSSTPWSPAPASQSPALILLPGSTEDVSNIMKVCSRRRIPVTAYSGGTSFGGALTATRGGVCIDFGRMDNVVAVHEEDMDVVVQPGVEWQELNRVLEGKGLFFPPDPGPGARIGGMIAMSCSGTNAYRHGTMRPWVTSLTLVLPNGTILKTRHRPRKSSAGYDLTSLIVGSEGTLALVTEAVLKITSLPKNQRVVVATFPDTHAAVRAAIVLIKSGMMVDAIELVDRYSIIAINKAGKSSRKWEEVPSLFLKFSGLSSRVVEEQIQIAEEASVENGCRRFEVMDDREGMDVAWSARKQVAPSLVAMKRDETDLFVTSDVAVPISRMAETIEWAQEIITEAGLVGSTMGHVGDGNFHAAIICPKDKEDLARSIIARLQRRAIELEGTVTGEHGIGLNLRDMLVEEVGENTVDMMRKIKLALDPQCILNCDKIIRME